MVKFLERQAPNGKRYSYNRHKHYPSVNEIKGKIGRVYRSSDPAHEDLDFDPIIIEHESSSSPIEDVVTLDHSERRQV